MACVTSNAEVFRQVALDGTMTFSDTPAPGEDVVESLWRSPTRYLWAMLLARIYESAPLACPQCGADMRIIAFVRDGVSVRRVLAHIGEPADPQRPLSVWGGRWADPLRMTGFGRKADLR